MGKYTISLTIFDSNNIHHYDSVCISGSEAWPPGVCLRYVGGDQFGHVNMVLVRSLDTQEMTDVSVPMCSPNQPGMYQGQWRMCTATGLYFGGKMICFL